MLVKSAVVTERLGQGDAFTLDETRTLAEGTPHRPTCTCCRGPASRNATRPRLPLPDEPFTGVDVPTQELLGGLLERLAADGAALSSFVNMIIIC
ncbi:hypothetical protein [Streptomyces sp. NPDC055400]